jgi:DNA mismatch repair protein MutL
MGEAAANLSENRNPIRVLSDEVINQIAAGEVVERPASVVREIVENAIDAAASDIRIDLEEGGIQLIRVTDNGIGMRRDDALLAFERHATSKVSTPQDLEGISSLGFRGEALAAIAAVARIEIRTRPMDAGVSGATLIRLEGGIVKEVGSASGEPGTTLEVRNLFFNTPARRKFLKQPPTEFAHVKQWLTSFALAHPAIGFRLTHAGKEALSYRKGESFFERASRAIQGHSCQFFEEGDGIMIRGVMGHPAEAGRDAALLVAIVNGRVVKDRILTRAVRDGFGGMVKGALFPRGVIELSLPPTEVDVNVHPQKSEVRFRDTQRIYVAVRHAVEKAVSKLAAATTLDILPTEEGAKSTTQNPLPRFEPRPLYGSARNSAWAGGSRAPIVATPVRQSTLSYATQAAANFENSPAVRDTEPGFQFSKLRYHGIALECYLLCEDDHGLVVVDMHAAHERFNYNLLLEQLQSKAVPAQALLIPLSVRLTVTGVQNVISIDTELRKFGFEIDELGEDTVVVRSAPALLRTDGIKEMLEELSLIDEGRQAGGTLAKIQERIAARLACHASIRSGHTMTRESVYALFEGMDRSEYNSACPHGRPIVKRFSPNDVARWFGRI